MRWILWLPVAVFGAMYLVFGPDLPDPMASHFNLAGEPDATQSKTMFFALGLGAHLLILGIFGGVGWLVERLPARMINLPNREYWLAPERRGVAIARFSRGMGVFGLVTLLFLNAVFYLVIRTNLDRQPLDGLVLGALLGVLVAAVVGLVIWLLVAFKVPDE